MHKHFFISAFILGYVFKNYVGRLEPSSKSKDVLELPSIPESRNKILTRLSEIDSQNIACDNSNKIEVATINSLPVSHQTKLREKFLKDFDTLIEEHYSDSTFDKGKAAKLLNMDERTLSRKLAKFTNKTFTQHLKSYRLVCAKEAIISGQQITRVCFDVGFTNASHFSTTFKTQFGVPPSRLIDSMFEEINESKLNT